MQRLNREDGVQLPEGRLDDGKVTRDTGLLRQTSLRGNHRRVTSANCCQAAREGKGQSLAGQMEREAVSPKPVTPDRQWPHWTEPRGNLHSPKRSRPRAHGPKHSSASSLLPTRQPTGQLCPTPRIAAKAGRPHGARAVGSALTAGIHPSHPTDRRTCLGGSQSFWYRLGPQTCSQSTHPPHCLPPTTQRQKNGDQRKRGEACSQMLASPPPPPPQLRARPSQRAEGTA